MSFSLYACLKIRNVRSPSVEYVVSVAVAAIELHGVVKRFGPITAVDGLDLEVPQGICLGLLGPNGAGKSTTMRMLTGQARQDEGTIHVLGHDLPAESKEARALMGVVPQLDNLDVDVTVEDNLAVFARLYRVRDVKAAVDYGLNLARLDGRRRDAVDQLSGGMRRRLLLARALMHEPALVILDEPTAGVDFELRLELWAYIRRLHSLGTTILLTTHYLEEAEELCEDIALIRGGRVLARDSAPRLREAFAADSLADVYVKAMAS